MIPPQISPVLVRFWSTSHLCNTFWRYQLCILFRYFRWGVLFLIRLDYYHSIHILQTVFQVIQLISNGVIELWPTIILWRCKMRHWLSFVIFCSKIIFLITRNEFILFACMLFFIIINHQSYEIKCILKKLQCISSIISNNW